LVIWHISDKETGWELLEIPFGDDKLWDMHHFNSFEYIKDNYVNSLLRYTEAGR